MHPTQSGWNDGDRQMACLLAADPGGLGVVSGTKLTGTGRDSRT